MSLCQVLPAIAADETVLHFAAENNYILVTCNRDDFLKLAPRFSHYGIVILIRRKSRAAERAALVQLLDRASESGIIKNINFVLNGRLILSKCLKRLIENLNTFSGLLLKTLNLRFCQN